MRILISGASGFLGSALTPRLEAAGHEVVRLVRRAPTAPREVAWDPARGALDRTRLEAIDAVVHLSGEGLADGRWTPDRKQRLLASRVESTRLLAESITRLEPRPAVMVSMSAMGFYGDRGEEELTEASREGRGFLPALVRVWEQAADPARRAGIRVVHPRAGLVLSPRGGALARMLPQFRLGVGGPIGGGRAWWSWIALDDALAAFEFALTNDRLAGPVNVTSPTPVRSAEMAHTLGRVLGRPSVVRVPAFALRALFGEMADETLLASTRALPVVLERAGFTFRHTRLEDALREELGRPAVAIPAA